MNSVSAQWESLLLFGALSIAVLAIAKKKCFFSLQRQKRRWIVPLPWHQLLAPFALYFAIAFFFVPLLLRGLHLLLPVTLPLIAFSTWANFLSSVAVLLSLFWYLHFKLPFLAPLLWRREKPGRWISDAQMVLWCWLFSFPLILFANHLLDLFLFYVFGIIHVPEQLVVTFFKMTFGHPLYLVISMATILLLAPFIEELLFRGFLQTFFRQHLGTSQAILLSSVCFSLFHYLPEQGLGNVSIIGSLFVLALFLGFAYEKQGSLFTSISLHSLFNASSVVNFYFFSEVH